MKNALEIEVTLDEQGKPWKKKIVIGPIVVCAIVAIVREFFK